MAALRECGVNIVAPVNWGTVGSPILFSRRWLSKKKRFLLTRDGRDYPSVSITTLHHAGDLYATVGELELKMLNEAPSPGGGPNLETDRQRPKSPVFGRERDEPCDPAD